MHVHKIIRSPSAITVRETGGAPSFVSNLTESPSEEATDSEYSPA